MPRGSRSRCAREPYTTTASFAAATRSSEGSIASHARLDDIVGRHRVLHGDDDEPGGNRTVVNLDGVRGYAARAKPAENLAAELVVAHAGDDGGGAAELVQMARHVRGGAAEEKTRGEGILRWGRERGADERDGRGRRRRVVG